MGKKLQLLGQRFGRLEVIEELPSKKNSSGANCSNWLSICDCGELSENLGSHLTSGDTQSCGCLFKEKRKEETIDLVGQKFGLLTVVSRGGGYRTPKTNKLCTTWKCLCNCGNTTEVTGTNLKKKSSGTKSCGCLLLTLNSDKKYKLPEDIKIVSRSEAKSSGDTRYFTGKGCINGHVAERSTINGRCVECAYSYRKNTRYSTQYNSRKRSRTPEWVVEGYSDKIKDLYNQSKLLTEDTGVLHHVDHIIPLTHELVCGLHVPWNLQVIPAKDNMKKSNKFDVGDNNGN